jgi:hypothetical protein
MSLWFSLNSCELVSTSLLMTDIAAAWCGEVDVEAVEAAAVERQRARAGDGITARRARWARWGRDLEEQRGSWRLNCRETIKEPRGVNAKAILDGMGRRGRSNGIEQASERASGLHLRKLEVGLSVLG